MQLLQFTYSIPSRCSQSQPCLARPQKFRIRAKQRKGRCTLSSASSSDGAPGINSENSTSSKDGDTDAPQKGGNMQMKLPPPPSFLPRMFHAAWHEAIEEVQSSSASPPISPEQRIQELKDEVRLLAQGKVPPSSSASRPKSNTGSSQSFSNMNSGVASDSAASASTVSSREDSISMATSSGSPAASAHASSTTDGDGRVGSEDAGVFARPLSRWPWVSWSMVGWTLILFWKQWQPLLPILLSAAQHPGEWAARTAAVCLILPDTPAVSNCKMNVLDFISGNWRCALPAAFLHSGLIPTLIFTRGLLEVSTLLEESFGPAVLTMQAAAAALGAASLQALLLPSTHTISGPAVVCGLYASLAVHISRTQQLAERVALRANGKGDVDAVAGSLTEGADQEQDFQRSPYGQEGALSTRTGYLCGLAALVLGLYQPMLGLWAVMGGVLGGVLSALYMPWVMAGLQGVLFYSLVLVHRVWGFARSLPQLLITSIVSIGQVAYLVVLELIKTVRQI